MLPVRQVLLEGILGADLVSFNHFDYVRHFLNSCTRWACTAVYSGVQQRKVLIVCLATAFRCANSVYTSQ